MGQRARHHVADDVAARAERRQRRGVDARHELVELALVDDVVLHALPCGEAQLVVGERRDPIERQPLRRADHASGTEARTMHE